MGSSYIDVAGTTSGKDKEKARQYWSGLNRVQTEVNARAATSSQNFIPWQSLVPANISKPDNTAFTIEGNSYTANEIAAHLKAGTIAYNERAQEYELVHG
ncbi:MAG: hypothetical protein AAF182_00790 [Pseudomonadota bacterium]